MRERISYYVFFQNSSDLSSYQGKRKKERKKERLRTALLITLLHKRDIVALVAFKIKVLIVSRLPLRTHLYLKRKRKPEKIQASARFESMTLRHRCSALTKKLS